MSTPALPPPARLYRAVVERDTTFVGVFVLAVRTTGIFCRPGCTARTPRRENVEFFASPAEALKAGYRPCLRCKPLNPQDDAPSWVERVIDLAERHSGRRLTAADLRRAGIEPARAARYFKSRYGMTFQAYHRLRRLSGAVHHLREGRSVTVAQQQAGFESASGFRAAFASVFGEPPSRAERAGAPLRVLSAAWLPTPMGPMLAVASDDGLCMLEFVDRRGLQTQIDTLRRPGVVIVPGRNRHIATIERELAEYFAGRPTRFTVALDTPGTPFQAKVWTELKRIPRGQTRSYAQVARAIGAPDAVRAVARANGQNRIAIIIPCHRVIGSDGSLTGYAGGLERKQKLLAIEGVESDLLTR